MNAALDQVIQTSGGPVFSPYNLAAWSGGDWSRMPDSHLGKIQQDTRTLEPGCVYIALIGNQFDGHDFVDKALEAEAAAVIANRTWSGVSTCPLPCLRVEDTQQALTDLAAGYRSQWKASVIGITGSAGKTTAKDFAASLFETIGVTSSTVKNYNNHIGVPLSLLAGRKDMEFGVYEMGMNRPGEIAPLAHLVSPDAAIMTPVGLAHKEAFATEKDIAIEKSQLLRAVNPNGFCVLNRDLPWFDLLYEASTARVITVSLDESVDADWHAVWDGEEIVFRHHGRNYIRCLPQWKPNFVARTALQAIAAAAEWGAVPEDLMVPVESFCPSGRRWNQLDYAGVVYVDDTYNANPLSMMAALDALEKEAVPGESWAVLGEMKELGDIAEEEHKTLGKNVADRSIHCIAYGEAGKWIAEGFGQVSTDAVCFHAADAETAAEYLREHIHPGDGVLFKASRGVRLEQVIERWVSGGGR